MPLPPNSQSESTRMISHPLSREVVAASIKTAPPVTVWALSLNEWVAIATIGYVVLQAGYLLWKWRREWKAKQAD